jgi:hypothetical protein
VRDLLDLRVQPVYRDHKVSKVSQVYRACQAYKEFQVTRDLQVPRGHRDHKVSQVFRELKVLRVMCLWLKFQQRTTQVLA